MNAVLPNPLSGRRLVVVASSFTLALATSACGAIGSSGSGSSEYPDGNIEMVIAYAAGGTIDVTGRQVAKALEEKLGTSVVVKNQEGGAGAIGMSAIANAKPDGYTIGFVPSTDLAYQSLVSDEPAYDASNYEAYKVSVLPTIFVADADSDIESLEGLSEAVSQGENVHIGTAGTGTPPDLSARAWNSNTGGKATIVPFAGGGAEALRSLLSGEVEVWSGYSPAVLGQVQAGDLKVIGVLDDEPYSLFPDASLPETGSAEDYLPYSMYVVVPKGAPAEVRDAFDEAMPDVVSEDIADFLEETGQVGDYADPATSADYLAELTPSFQKLIDSGAIS